MSLGTDEDSPLARGEFVRVHSAGHLKIAWAGRYRGAVARRRGGGRGGQGRVKGAGRWGWKAKLALVLGAGYTVLAALGSLFLACKVALCGETTATSSPARLGPDAQASVASRPTEPNEPTVESEVGSWALAAPPAGRLAGPQDPVGGSTAMRSIAPAPVETGPGKTGASPPVSKSGQSASSAGPTEMTPRVVPRSRQRALDVDRLHEQNVKASAEPRPAGECCKVCKAGQPCGDSCISRSKLCHKPPGCAC